jgi:hypothetical protein
MHALLLPPQIWVCENGQVQVWKEDIRAYKRFLAKKMHAAAKSGPS